MSQTTSLHAVFARGLGIALERISESLAYNTIAEWDSVAHMNLVAEIERAYDVMLDTDDIIDMNSVAKAREILARYGVTPG
jgi:acyl carrier protein